MDETELKQRYTAAIGKLNYAVLQFGLVHGQLTDRTKGLTCIDLVRRVDEAAAMCTKARKELLEAAVAAEAALS